MKKTILAIVMCASAIAAIAQTTVVGNLSPYAYGTAASVQSRSQTTLDAQGNFVLSVQNSPSPQTITMMPPPNSPYSSCSVSANINPGMANNVTLQIQTTCLGGGGKGVNLGIANVAYVATDSNGNAIAGVPPVSGVVPIAGALADYDFLQGTGTTLTDISGHGNNGTLGSGTNAPTWVTSGLRFSAGTNVGQNVQLPSALNGARSWCFSSYTDSSPTSGAFVGPAFQYTFFTTSSLGKSGILLSQIQEIPNIGGYQNVSIYAPGIWSNGGIPTDTNALISGFHTVCFTLGIGSGDNDRIYIDGAESQSYTGQGASAGFQTSGNIYLGGNQGTNLGDNVGFAGTMYRATVFSAELTPTQINLYSSQMTAEVGSRGVPLVPRIFPLANPQLYAVGDSITYALSSGGTPYITLMTFTNQPSWALNNYGIPGITLQSIAGGEPNRLAPTCQGSQGPAWVIIMAGINDAEKINPDAPFVAAFMSYEVTLLKTSGCHVLVGTILSASGEDTFKNSYDALLLDQIKTMNADGVVDFAANPLMGADGAYANTTYFVDGLHPTPAGDALLATAASNSMNYYFGSTAANPHVVTATTYTLLSGDRFVTAAPTGNAAYTMPDCTGPSGESYVISNPQSAHTLTITGGASQPINGSAGAITISSGSTTTLRDVPNPKATSGCGWSM